MPGPASKTVKHGHTPTTGANDWTDVDDVPFEGAPALPRLGATERSRAKWHLWTEQWYAQVSKMPHCKLWKPSDWQLLFDLARMKDAWYKEGEDAKASMSAQIRLRERDLGIGPGALTALKIRYRPVRDDASGEPDLRAEGQRAVEQANAASDPSKAGKVTSLDARRAAITKSA